MLKTDKNIDDVCFILDNLRDEDEQEVKALWGENWRSLSMENIEKSNYQVLIGFDEEKNKIPIAVGGIEELFEKNSQIACVWLLCSKYVKYNKQLLFRTVSNVLFKAENKYKVMYNYIYKSNFKAKKWLKTFGFCFNNPKPENIEVPDNFEFFYKTS